MLKKHRPVSFIATLDAEKARVFYEDRLGLTLLANEYFALVFDLNGHTLRIAKVDELAAARHTVLGWEVDDITATVNGLAERGVVFDRFEGMDQDELGIWLSPSGAKVAWFKDPDGNNLSITQLA